MMRLCVALACLTAWLATVSAADEKKVVCYFGSWSVYRHGNGRFEISNIEPKLCTHMIYTFVGITEEGGIKVLDPWSDLPDNWGKDGFGNFNKLRERNPSTKTLVAIGGWNQGSALYSKVMKNPSLRAKFVNNAVEFVLKYDFDGFDVDWEYPNQRGGVAEDKNNFVLLLKELRSRFDEYGLLLSAAVASAKTSAELSYDIPRVSKYLHFINLMTYDLHGSWESSVGHNTPLYAASREVNEFQRNLNINATVHYWLHQGAPAEKLVLGTALYGRSFTLRDATQNQPGSPASGPGNGGSYTSENGMLGYNEICESQIANSWTIEWDDEQRVPYAYKGNQWVGYDNVRSITEKAMYAMEMGLGGAMVWSIETDDFNGICGDKYPLLDALNRVLRNDGDTNFPNPTQPSVVSPPRPSTTLKPTDPTSPATTTSNPGTSGEICTKPGYVRDKKNCAKFYICEQIGQNLYKATPFLCPNRLAFDTKYNVCNYKEQVDCSSN